LATKALPLAIMHVIETANMTSAIKHQSHVWSQKQEEQVRRTKKGKTIHHNMNASRRLRLVHMHLFKETTGHEITV
jgi:hypothetical protein